MAMTRAKVRLYTPNDIEFNHAQAYAGLGRIKHVETISHENFIEIIAIVDCDKAYGVHLNLDINGQSIINADCNCETFENNPGLCRHAAAVLLAYIDEKSMSAASDRLSSYLLNLYRQLDRGSAERELEGELEHVRFQPVLELNYMGPRLRLKVGRERMYVIKDFTQLYNNMINGIRTEYGRQFQWSHSINSIDPEDRPLMQIILEYCEAVQLICTNNHISDRIGAALPLTSPMLDRLMLFFMETKGEILLREGSKERGRLLIQDNPRLKMIIAREERGIRLSYEHIMFLTGSDFIYFIDDKHILLADSDCRESLAPILKAMAYGDKSLFLSEKDMPAFFSSVYPAIEPYMEFSGDTSIAQDYLPLPLHCRLELDAPDNDQITCQIKFSYNCEHFNPLDDNAPAQIRRDEKNEMKKCMQLTRLFQFKRGNQLVFTGDDEQIYGFLSEKLALLEQIGELYVSDRLKRLITPPSARVSACIALESDLLRLDIDVSGFGVEELWAVLESYRANRRYYRLKSGQYLTLDDDALGGLSEMVQTLSLNEAELLKGSLTLPAYRALYLDNLLRGREQLYYRRNDSFKALVRNIRNVEDSDFRVPIALSDTLRNYQKTGYRWMRTLCAANLNGLLADDMGLGKTIQVIALLLAMKENEGAIKALVICPASLVLNWKSEIERFGKALRVTALTGAAHERQELVAQADYDVIVTSYDQLKRDIASYISIEFDFEILDEAQTIKNASTQAAKACKAIRARRRFALTGTPIENRLSELWSIFDFLMPGYLFSYKRFRQSYEIPAVRKQDDEALKRVNRLVAPFILRRMKGEVLHELPDKIETVKMTELAGEQQRLYLAHMLRAQKEISSSLETDSLLRDKLKILALLTRLRQICCDPALFMEEYKGESAKLELCMELIDEAVRSGHRVLLFSQFTSMLELIEKRLSAIDIASYTLRGSTTKRMRQEYISRFQEGIGAPVFLISLKAGGLGLNLTGADVVILYDPWWNTSAENQAADRAYRMGQKKNVQIIRLIAKGTIEERILDLQQKKRALADTVITEGNALTTLTNEDWSRLFSYGRH